MADTLDGAAFSYAEYDVKTHEVTTNWTAMKDNGNGYFTLYPDGDENPVYLDYNKVYAVDETERKRVCNAWLLLLPSSATSTIWNIYKCSG